MRKHKRHNEGHWLYEVRKGVTVCIGRAPRRRQHGLLRDVAITPKVTERAQSRAKLYMHSAARRRAEA